MMARQADFFAMATRFLGKVTHMPTQLPQNAIHPKSRNAWRAWLQKQHTRKEGVWLISYKKATGKPRMEMDEAVTEALCFGWIDSKPAALDEERSMLWFSPRKSGTGWSKVNKERIARASAAGLMLPAGLAKIEQAKQDGSWGKLDAVEALEVPEDLAHALTAHAPAAAHFEAFPRSTKRAILEWIGNAKSAATREKRVHETAELAEKNIRANQWRQ
jgi:uncharacterized protein YdeI (YjbR/CyaY-like superfamily)